MMKRIKKIGCIIGVLLLLLILPLSEVIAYKNLTPTYSETFYGEFNDMYQRIKTTEKKKIVIIGNSSVAFGVNVSFMESELSDYVVCPFGLYGAIGTKAMLDISSHYLKEGDIVIISPEINSQAMSLYFSASEIYKAADGNMDVLKDIKKEDRNMLVGGFVGSLQERYSYEKEGKPTADGVYSHQSFNSSCQMIYQREYNIMPSLYDENDILDFSLDLIRNDFVSYLNDYYQDAYFKNVSVFYNFAPINKKAILPTADIGSFYNKISSSIQFPVLGNINNYLYDAEWFYDSNFHLNSSGSILYSSMLTEDIKSVIGDYSKTEVEALEKPEPPISLIDGDNSQEADFLYEMVGNGYKIVDRSIEGSKKTSYVIPTMHEGKPVVSFDSSVFYGDSFIEELTIPASIRIINDNSFVGCVSLKKIIMLSESCNSTCGFHLLDGCNNSMIYVSNRESYIKYCNNYYWGNYSARITYEK